METVNTERIRETFFKEKQSLVTVKKTGDIEYDEKKGQYVLKNATIKVLEIIGVAKADISVTANYFNWMDLQRICNGEYFTIVWRAEKGSAAWKIKDVRSKETYYCDITIAKSQNKTK